MSSITPNLRLNVPDFDQIPWDVDVNTNWAVLDATVGMFAAIPNLTGVWVNSHTYTYGQSAIDMADSSIWMCVQTHTSSAAPTTFATDRVYFPAYWTMTTQGAQFWATQAANSAAAAAASAADAAASAGGASVLLTGSTMTGPLILSGNPAVALGAATKQYVDAQVGGVGYLPLTGGTITGQLTISGGIVFSNWTTYAHSMSFGWDSLHVVAAVDGINVGALASISYVNDNYLPLSGGSITGNLYVAGESQAQTTHRIVLSGAYFGSSTNDTVINWDSSGWRLDYARATGQLTYYRSDNVALFVIDGNGNTSTNGSIGSGHDIASVGNIFSRGGAIYWGAGDRAMLVSDNASYTDMRMLDLYRWNLAWATGTLAWFRYDNIALLTLDISGNLSVARDVHAATDIYAHNNEMRIGVSGSSRYLQFSSGWHWVWDSSVGNLYYQASNSGFFDIRTTDNQAGNTRGPMFGNGAYNNISDERVKRDIQPSAYGLHEIMLLQPISFERIGAHILRVEHGFSAQQVQTVIPDAVTPVSEDGETLGVALDPIVAALVNGMKELTRRVNGLEGRDGTAAN